MNQFAKQFKIYNLYKPFQIGPNNLKRFFYFL